MGDADAHVSQAEGSPASLALSEVPLTPRSYSATRETPVTPQPELPPRAAYRSPLRSPKSPTTPRRSPVNLPIRSGDSPRRQSLGSPVPPIPGPSASLTPSRQTSPLRTVPADDSPGRASLASVVREYPDPSQIDTLDTERGLDAEDELIFDNDDNRLPPPVQSPSQQRIEARPEGVAVSSPDLPPELPPDEFDEMDEGGGPLGEHLFGAMMEPQHVQYSPEQERAQSGIFYPAPIPMQLMLPPLLSARSKAKARERPGLRRPKSAILVPIPEPPHWDPSPLENELQYTSKQFVRGDTASLDSVPVGDLIDDDDDEYADSDRATVMSEEDRDDFEDPLDAPFSGPVPGGSPKRKNKRRSILGRTWEAFTGKDGGGEDDVKKKDAMGFDMDENDILKAQMAIDDDIAFTRLDPELVQRHAEMFHAGGVHSSTVPLSGKPTSLIEEIEIRKAGKKVQQQLLLREIAENQRQRLHELGQGGHRHPIDAFGAAQPTLLRLQQLADEDYKHRVEWHQRAINKNHIQEHSSESLAQRRARIKAEKAQRVADAAPPETLGQRRERLRRARLNSEQASLTTAAAAKPSSVHSISEHGSEDAQGTPALSSEHRGETPEFDMVEAVAMLPSPTSQMFTSPAR